MQVSERVAKLRELMKAEGLAAYVVPSTDPHQSEYVASTWQRRGFISGFDGSAGTVVVTTDKAGLWTDSRYFLQAGQQLQGSGIDLFRMGDPGVPDHEQWLAFELHAGDRVGLDPRVVSMASFEKLEGALATEGIVLAPVGEDLVEKVWGAARPPMPTRPVFAHPTAYAGKSVGAKLELLTQAMATVSADAHVLAALDEIAWLFNLRGGDVPFNPVFIAFAVVEKEGATLFLDPDKVTKEVREALPENVRTRPYEEIDDALRDLGAAQARVWFDPTSVNAHIAGTLAEAGAELFMRTGPVPAWKAAKNSAEIAGIKAAHVRDGVAMVQFMRWLYEAVPEGKETELTIKAKLTQVRKAQEKFVGMSFNSIVGYGPHGAIVHYAVDDDSNVPVVEGNLLLVDSGGQYRDGTTDITRTVALGTPGEAQKRAYTAVLKGHLNLGRAQFVEGTNGYQLDVLARAPLWGEGLNYGHGTGHGVGAFLCVHEGPFSVSLRRIMVPLQPGHVLSNEPGYYEADGYGIRIENLVQVVQKDETASGRFFGFENLTLCPYDRNLIVPEMLSAKERAQVNTYHAEVLEVLSPLLDAADRAWLTAACKPM